MGVRKQALPQRRQRSFLTQLSLTANEFSISYSGGTVTPTLAIPSANGPSLVYSGGQLTGVLRLQYSGTQVRDSQRDELRHKDISLGTSGADIIDGSSRGANQALLGHAGNDVLTGGSGDDLLIGGAGNDNLTGGLGADTFRFGQFETGQDTINDFNVNQGDKIDLRGLLADSGLTLDNLTQYLRLELVGLNQMALKVDTLGSGNFSSPDMTVTLLTPQGINDDLQTLIDQRVFAVI
jgi:Ca2+-binding RTX toxin-like protein